MESRNQGNPHTTSSVKCNSKCKETDRSASDGNTPEFYQTEAALAVLSAEKLENGTKLTLAEEHALAKLMTITHGPKELRILPMTALQAENITGGITNRLFRVSRRFSTTDSTPCLVRLFGANTELIIDRSREQLIEDQLSRAGTGKEIYGRFPSGQVEEWVPGCVLCSQSLKDPKIRPLIAAKLSELHNTYLTPEVIRATCRRFSMLSSKESDAPVSGLWPQLWRWLEAAREAQATRSGGALSLFNFDVIERHIVRVKARADVFNSQIVLGHNDLLCGNIVLQGPGEIRFLDFEYAGPVERGYDIANHFCEHCGFEWDLRRFPTMLEAREFIETYLSMRRSTETASNSDPAPTQAACLMEEVRAFLPASHLFWGLWALIQSVYSTIDFDYGIYAYMRLSALWHPSFQLGRAACCSRHAKGVASLEESLGWSGKESLDWPYIGI